MDGHMHSKHSRLNSSTRNVKVSQEQCKRPVESMPRRTKVVISFTSFGRCPYPERLTCILLIQLSSWVLRGLARGPSSGFTHTGYKMYVTWWFQIPATLQQCPLLKLHPPALLCGPRGREEVCEGPRSPPVIHVIHVTVYKKRHLKIQDLLLSCNTNITSRMKEKTANVNNVMQICDCNGKLKVLQQYRLELKPHLAV